MNKFEVKEFINRNKKTIAIVVMAVVVLEIALICILLIPRGGLYSVAYDGNAICTLKSKNDASRVVKNVVEHYTPKDTDVKAVDTEGTLKIVKAKDADKDNVYSVKEATNYILEDFQKGNNPIKITISSVRTKKAEYIPTPKYIKDEEMVAGESKVVKKGTPGTQKVSVTYISVNGKIKSSSVTFRQVIDKGKKATVKKGTIGLPKGKDWKTFTGAPIFKDGEELSKAGLSHLGAPYRYGGSSFKTGIDCVQFVRALYRQYGINLPNGHRGIQHVGKGVSLANAKKGDIVCYSHHMGIYIGNGRIVNALHGGVGISKVKTGKLVTIRRVVK